MHDHMGSFTAESHPPTCMMNVSEWLVLRGCAGHLKQIYMWRVAYCDTCGMTMHGNVWYWLIFKVTWPVGSVAATNGSSTSHSDTKMPTPGEHAPTIFVMKRHDHAWECMILAHIQRVSGSFTAESHSPTCTMNVSEWLVLRGWDDMTMHENVWYWLRINGCLGPLRLSRIPRHAWWMYQNDSYPGDVRVTQNRFTCDGSHNATHAFY